MSMPLRETIINENGAGGKFRVSGVNRNSQFSGQRDTSKILGLNRILCGDADET